MRGRATGCGSVIPSERVVEYKQEFVMNVTNLEYEEGQSLREFLRKMRPIR